MDRIASIAIEEKESQSNFSFLCYVVQVGICPADYGDWVHESEYCYKTWNQKKNWDDAQQHCGSMGGTLIKINSAKENKLIAEHIKKDLQNSLQPGVWLGGRRSGTTAYTRCLVELQSNRQL